MTAKYIVLFAPPRNIKLEFTKAQLINWRGDDRLKYETWTIEGLNCDRIIAHSQFRQAMLDAELDNKLNQLSD